MTSRDDAERYRENRQDEIDGAALYQAMAENEPTPQLAEVYRRLAAVERRHADFWTDRLRSAGEDPGAPRPTWRARLLGALARRFGASAVLPTVRDAERAGQGMYDDQPETQGTTLRHDERSHARVLQTISGSGGVEGAALGRFEGRHRAVGGNALRAAVLGANDGLLSNLSLVMGVAGAALPREAVVVTGVAGLLAGAGSMALGEWVSVQSSRELAERQIRVERDELAAYPDEEREELALIYEAKGLSPEDAARIADRLLTDPAAALDVMTREELGLDPDELGGSAWQAAVTSFVLFALGAIVPVVPFLFLGGVTAVAVSLAAGAVGLFGLGAAITLFTGRPVWRSGGRQLVLGIAAAAVTYGIGALLGVSLGG